MQLKNVIFLALAFTSSCNTVLQAQHTGSKATFNGKMNMKQIPTNVGRYYILLQDCDTSIAPKLNARQFIFQHAKMGKIKDARMIYEMLNDTVQSITIEFENELEREQAVKQAQKQFGPADFSQNDMLNVYRWAKSPFGFPISISLAYTGHEATSAMLIEKMKK